MIDDETREGILQSDPRFVVEIMSPTTRAFDVNEKLEDYKTVPILEYILLVDPDFPQVRLYRRDAARKWTSEKAEGLEAVVELPELGLHLRIADVYAAFVPLLGKGGGR